MMPSKILGVKRTKGGIILCEHGIIKYACKLCNSKVFCKHGVMKRQCVPCRGSAICEHGRIKYSCKDCHGSNICHHDKFRDKCADCVPKGTYLLYRRGAEKRGLVFELTFEDYLRLSDSPCHYCGIQRVRNGVDRKDNSVGYTLENSGPCCSECNLMKRNYSVEKFLGHVRQIEKFQQTQN